MTGRYKATGPEAEYEPGSRGRVLRNLAGIKSVRQMQQRESEALTEATDYFIDTTEIDKRFLAADIREIHRRWLGDIYPWAGEYRSVNVSKDGFMFAAAAQVPRLMEELESGPLREFTPCHFSELDDQVRALAITHAELILVHPFREGNGRCARLMATLMGLQAGLDALNFEGIRGAERQRYISAIHASMNHTYEPMFTVFRKVIARTMRRAEWTT